jgi:hypothetical protein
MPADPPAPCRCLVVARCFQRACCPQLHDDRPQLPRQRHSFTLAGHLRTVRKCAPTWAVRGSLHESGLDRRLAMGYLARPTGHVSVSQVQLLWTLGAGASRRPTLHLHHRVSESQSLLQCHTAPCTQTWEQCTTPGPGPHCIMIKLDGSPAAERSRGNGSQTTPGSSFIIVFSLCRSGGGAGRIKAHTGVGSSITVSSLAI